MKLRSSTRRSEAKHKLACWFGALISAGLSMNAAGQDSADSEPFLADEEVTQVRFWNLTAPGTGDLVVELASTGTSYERILDPSRPGTISGSAYWHLKPGRLGIRVTEKSSGKQVGEINEQTSAPQWLTIVAANDPESDGGVKVSLIDDTYTFRSEDSGMVTIFNSIPEVTVSAAVPGLTREPIAVGADKPTEIKSIPATGAELVLSFVDGGKAPFFSSIPVDFSDGKRVSVMVMRDRYGRVRARAFNSGFVIDPELPPMDQSRE